MGKLTINPKQQVAMLAVAVVLLAFGIAGIVQRGDARRAAREYKAAAQTQQKQVTKQLEALSKTHNEQTTAASDSMSRLDKDSDEYATLFQQTYSGYGKDLLSIVKQSKDQQPKLARVFLGSFASNAYRSMSKKSSTLSEKIGQQYTYAQARSVFFVNYFKIHESVNQAGDLATYITTEEKASAAAVTATSLTAAEAASYVDAYQGINKAVDAFKKLMIATPTAPVDIKNRDSIIKAANNFQRQRTAAIAALKKHDLTAYKTALTGGSDEKDGDNYNNFIVAFNTFITERGGSVQKYDDAESTVRNYAASL